MTIRIGLVDDQPLVRSGFAMVINSQDDMEVVLEASNGKQALERLALVPVDVVLMDIRMPTVDGLEATERLVHSTPSHGVVPKVIILTTFDLDEYVMKAIHVGASGFLLKDANPDQMLTAIRNVYQGDAVLAPTATKRLVQRLADENTQLRSLNPGLITDLTERETEVLSLIARGKSNSEIASELFVAEATVKTHVGRIFNKLGARDRVQAVVIAYESGLVRPGDFDEA